MKQIADMLGVELDEEFKIENREGKFKIMMCGLMDTKYHVERMNDLMCLLKGSTTVIKLPWKPKLNETYWFVGSAGIVEKIWGATAIDAALCAFGNCFRTKEEAEAHEDEILQKMKEVMGE